MRRTAAPPPLFIDQTPAVEALALELRAVPRLALDTEFHSERRYRPRLMLLQLALDDGRSFVLDALRCDLRALGPVFASVELVVHGGSHDVDLVTQATGVPLSGILDVQRAAALVGDHYPARLEDLLLRHLGERVQSSQALSDWSVRPLHADQLRYAAADVQLLLPLADVLEARLQASGRSGLARTVSAELLAAVDAPPRPLDAWRQWEVAPRLDEQARRVLSALMQWRDRAGKERDQPPWFLLGDSITLELARSRPRTPEDLAHDRRIAGGLRRQHGAELLATVQAALEAREPPPPVDARTPARARLLESFLDAWAPPRALAPGLLLSGGRLFEVAEHGPDALDGWRRALLEAPLRALWSGSLGVTMGPDGPALLGALDGALDAGG